MGIINHIGSFDTGAAAIPAAARSLAAWTVVRLPGPDPEGSSYLIQVCPPTLAAGKPIVVQPFGGDR